jgi:ParB family chromosome partitioning protein
MIPTIASPYESVKDGPFLCDATPSEEEITGMTDGAIYSIRLSDIEVSKLYLRRSHVAKNLDELAASIKRHGLLQPVVLIGEHGAPPYELIAGQRRYLAHERLKRKTIRAVFAGDIVDEKAILLFLVENLQSLDLNHADTARAITTLYETYGKDERKVQKETGLSLRRIRNYLTTESQASPKMKRLLREKKVKPADVNRALRAAQSSVRKAESLLDLMCEYELTKHQKKRILEFGEKHERASATKIVEEVVRPRVEQSIMVSLPEEVRQGLEQATKELQQEAEEIVTEILQNWLSEQGFIDEY